MPEPPRRATRGATRSAARTQVGPAVLGVVGELLVTAGVVLALFLVWQLWWTDVVADGEQQQIVRDLEQRWAGASPSDGAVAGPGADRVAPPQQEEPPTVPVPPTATVFATLRIPAFDRPVIPLAEGVGLEDVLNVLGAGHYPGTAMPGEVGNFAVAAHRTTYGKPFHDIDRLQPGDPVVVETQDAYYVYRVTSHEIVSPTDVAVIAPVPDRPGATPTARTMTMTACHPLYSAAQRYVVHLELEEWTRRADGVPAVLVSDHAAAAAPAAAGPSTARPAAAAPAATLPAATLPAAAGPVAAGPGVAAPALGA